ncbi:MAG: hypothetical protein M3Y87_35130 [Myxococcota bacterium]|nr:hypothetical protein [Myxococcota bacterium]
MMRRTIAVLALTLSIAACGPDAPEDFTVPERCYAEGSAIEIVGLEEAEVLHLHYGAQGGQHVYTPLTLRGVDPRSTSVRVSLARELDGRIIADQVFNRFAPGSEPCDVRVPRTELFVAGERADGLTALGRVQVFDAMRSETREVSGLCVSSDDTCGPHPLLQLEAGGAFVGPGDRVFLEDDGMLHLGVDPLAHGSGALWGRIGDVEVDAVPGDAIAIPATDGGAIEVRLVLSETSFREGGVLASFDGALTIGCSPLDASACASGETCDLGLAGEPSRCRAIGALADGDACDVPEDCAAGSTCAASGCRAWCDPAAPSCAPGETCIETLELGLCEPS